MAKLEFKDSNGNYYPVMIFRNDYNEKTYYRYGLSKKSIDGDYINGYVDCRFKKDVEIPNQTKIYIKQAWQDFYLNKEGKTVSYTFINEFGYVNEEPVDDVEDVDLDDILGIPDEEDDFSQEELELPFE